jgi:group I intron endonuclease
MNTIIYKATNIKNQKHYIGQTIRSLEERKKQHFYEARNEKFREGSFHESLIKNPGDFKWEILAEGFPYLFIDIFEKYWINYYDSYNNGYNLTEGGNKPPRLVGEKNPFYGKTHTKESIEKMLINRGKNEEWIKNVKNKSENHKKKISESNKKIRTDKWKETVGKQALEKRRITMKENGINQIGKNNGMYNKHHTEESKRIMSEKAKNRLKIVCPYCSKKCNVSNATRWHLENCKHKGEKMQIDNIKEEIKENIEDIKKRIKESTNQKDIEKYEELLQYYEEKLWGIEES